MSKDFWFFMGVVVGTISFPIVGSFTGIFEPTPISERRTACENVGGKYQLLYSVNTGYNESCIAPEVLMENRFLDF